MSYEIKQPFDPSRHLIKFDEVKADGTESRTKLPVAAQVTWFREVYPKGRFAIDTKSTGNGGFVSRARVYFDYKDEPGQFIAEATAYRCFDPDNPSISPLAWSQTAALGAALAYAGFGCQYQLDGNLAGADSMSNTAGDKGWNDPVVPDASSGMTPYMENGGGTASPVSQVQADAGNPPMPPAQNGHSASAVPDLHTGSNDAANRPPVQQQRRPWYIEGVDNEYERYQAACQMPSPIKKHQEMKLLLGHLVNSDTGAIRWIAAHNNTEVGDAARFILEYASRHAG